ncbi:MAG: hypothetical protein IKM59_03765 [Oscillospiraceae bacterium]|nr:hypothetical protein [Oscillospiraceae bacterium]
MADVNKLERAKQVYATLCQAIDERKWTYTKEEEKLLVHFSVRGDDLPMHFLLVVDADRQLVRLMSPLPFKMCEEKRIEGAIATCVASYKMVEGNFDYDLSDGEIVFRTTASFRDSVIGTGLFQYMISLSCAMVDKYNDLFLAIDKGIYSIQDFIEKN